MKYILGVLLTLTGEACGFGPSGKGANILFIMTDDQDAMLAGWCALSITRLTLENCVLNYFSYLFWRMPCLPNLLLLFYT